MSDEQYTPIELLALLGNGLKNLPTYIVTQMWDILQSWEAGQELENRAPQEEELIEYFDDITLLP